MLLGLQLNNLLGDAPTLVTVPDVVEETEAQGTSDLEAVLFVVAVATAYSSSVAIGLIISQDPAAGIDAVEGSTVTITVSLGEAPATETTSGGGWAQNFYFGYDIARAKREKRKRELEDMAEEQKAIEDAQTREIAELLRIQEEKDAEREDLARIQKLADQYAQKGAEVPRPILASVMKAHEERTRNALEQMRREIDRMIEDEELAVIAMLMLDD